MSRKPHFRIRSSIVIALLAGLLPPLYAATAPPAVEMPDSIREVAAAPAGGTVDPHRPYISRHALTQAETGAPLHFEVTLKLRNFAELQARVARGEHIPPQEMAARYEPLPADYQAAADWLTGQGLTITRNDPHHLAVFASGKIGQIQQAMKVTFARVSFEGAEYTSAVTAPTVPANLANLLVGINGLQPYQRAHRHLVHPDAVAAATTSYIPTQLAQAYGITGLYSSGVTGSGQTIAIVIDTFPSQSDLTTFWKNSGISQSINHIQFIQAVPGTLPAATGEETLDTEWSSSMAPGAKVRVYAVTALDGPDLDTGYDLIYNDVIDHPEYGIHQMSMSYGSSEATTAVSEIQADDQYFAELSAAGVTLFASSGDTGAEVDSPASDPNVAAVGGTTLQLDTNNNITSETAWSSGGGGVSTYFARPAWQTGTGLPAGTTRALPDIAAAANPNEGAVVYFQNASTVIGGTSWSSPSWAGMCALINQSRANAGLPPLSVLGPHIYPLLSSPSYPATYNADFRDITSGTSSSRGNGSHSAAITYDLATGLGSPKLQPLAQTLAVPQSLPLSQTILPGASATFTVATPETPTAWQWQRMPFGSSTWSSLANNATYNGATTASLTVSNANTSMTGDLFQCLVTLNGNPVASTSSALAVNVPLTISTLAGKVGTTGLVNGQGSLARFNIPSGLAVDSSGNLYIADYANNNIRKITPGGLVSTPYGSLSGIAGNNNSTGNSATFNLPNSVAIDKAGNLYVADSGNFVIRKIVLSTGQVSTFAGAVGVTGTSDGPGTTKALFTSPIALTTDKSGNVYVADTFYYSASGSITNNSTVREITPAGVVSTLAGQPGKIGFANGPGTQALFNGLSGIAADSTGNVYVADTFNDLVRKITPGGVVSTFAGQLERAGSADGPGIFALFDFPVGIASDSSDNLYVTDTQIPSSLNNGAFGTVSGNNLVRRITPSGAVSTIAGDVGITGSKDGTGSAAQFFSLQAAAVNGSGTLYLVDTFNETIRQGVLSVVVNRPSVSISANQPAASVYGPTAGQFSVTLTGNALSNLTVNYTVAGTALANTDYTSLPGTVTIPAGASSAAIPINPLFNSNATANPTVQVTLISSSSYTIASPGTASVTITEPTPYQGWQLTNFGANAYTPAIAGDLADPNNNGVPNLLEYAFNSSPLQTGTTPAPVVTTVVDSGNQYLAITYTQVSDPALTYTVQVTSDLTQQTDPWNSGATYTTVVSRQTTGNTTQVTVRDNTPITSSGKRFIRLQVAGP